LDVINAWNFMPFGGPAEWLVFAAADGDRLAEWITARKFAEWLKDGQLGPRPGSVNPIHEQKTFLTSSDLDDLAADTGIRPYIIHQHQGELVFIPAGCAHQVRTST
jgi:lysine-specific demethylase 3